MNQLKSLLACYRDKRFLFILLFGFFSGLPLLLTASTLGIWLLESSIDKTHIGIIAFISLPYTVKFLWAPFFDTKTIPWFTALLGRRRASLIILQALLALSIMFMSLLNPQLQPLLVASVAFLIAFLSASQDIIIDAWRTELLEEKLFGSGAAVAVFGYHLGMLVAGAGALYLASSMSWGTVYSIMSLIMSMSVGVTLGAREPQPTAVHKTSLGQTLSPLVEFFQRQHWLSCVLLVVTYKLGDAFLSSMSHVFLLEIGFSKIEIANIVKVFGVAATIFGGFIASILLQRFSVLSSMFICGVIHVVFNLAFVLQAHVGYNVELLVLTIAAENITGGMTSIALVAYISRECSLTGTATHFALLSSISAIGRSLLSSSSGYLATLLGWKAFFAGTSLLGMPALIGVLLMIKQTNLASLKLVRVK